MKEREIATVTEYSRKMTLRHIILLGMRVNSFFTYHSQWIFRAMSATLTEELSTARLRIEALSRSQREIADVAIGVFELSQQIENKWLTADIPTKRTFLQFLCLNFSATDAILFVTMNKPFDILAEGLTVHFGRGEWI